MPAPKGTRVVPFTIGITDAVHVYSDAQRIWLQLRRDVPTEQSIAKTSFKVALTLTPEQAIGIATELLTAATRKHVTANGVDKPIAKVRSSPASNSNDAGKH